MAQLCSPSPPFIDDANETNMVKAKLKRSPRCMQIDLLPLLATNITMIKTNRPHMQNKKISPAVWDEQLRLWTRNGTPMSSIKPTIQNSKVDQSLEESIQPQLSHAKESILCEDTDTDNNQVHDLHLLTISDLHESFSHINIATAPGRAWLSSMVDVSNYRERDVIAHSVARIERENHPEETSQLFGVESICTNLNVWNGAKQEGNDLDKSSRLNQNQQCSTLTLKADEDEECNRIQEDYFVEPQVNQPLKLCPGFISPWFDPKTYPLPDSQETLDISPNGGLDWTSDETTEGDDSQDFDGLGLRPQSESNRVRSRQYWNGNNENGCRRNVRQRVEDHSDQRMIADEFLDNYDGFEPGDNLTGWFPQPGDIIVTKRSRHGDHLSPGGHVTLYKDEEFFFFPREAREIRITQYDFQDGDFVIRLGKFTEDWKWRPNPSIEAFLCDLRQVRPWWLVARTYNNDLQAPEYQFDQFRAPVNCVDQTFRPRQGDLVVRAVPGEYKWGLDWWKQDFNFNPCDVVLRTGYEVRANGTCMVVELYYRELDDQNWSFRGRDVWTYLSMPGLGPQPA